MDGSAVKSMLAVLPEYTSSVPSTPQPLETRVWGLQCPLLSSAGSTPMHYTHVWAYKFKNNKNKSLKNKLKHHLVTVAELLNVIQFLKCVLVFYILKCNIWLIRDVFLMGNYAHVFCVL